MFACFNWTLAVFGFKIRRITNQVISCLLVPFLERSSTITKPQSATGFHLTKALKELKVIKTLIMNSIKKKVNRCYSMFSPSQLISRWARLLIASHYQSRQFLIAVSECVRVWRVFRAPWLICLQFSRDDSMLTNTISKANEKGQRTLVILLCHSMSWFTF